GNSFTGRPKKIEYMGQTSCSYDQLLNYVKTLSNNQFKASSYDVYTNNCIDFCKVLLTFLCNGVIPEYIQIAPRLGQRTAIGRFLKPLFASCSAVKRA
ncbi:Desumoylating isopeptidase 1, partial [Pseudolycoriella hygida]